MSDITQAGSLLRGDESAELGYAEYPGVEKRAKNLGKPVARLQKTLYRSLAKNTTQLFNLFGFANPAPAGNFRSLKPDVRPER